MAKIHAPHRQSGYLAGVEFEATADHEGRADWTMIYTPGPKAKTEHLAFTRRGGTAMLAIEPPPAEAKPPEVEPEPTGLERELVAHGVTQSVAADLVRDFPEDRIKAQIEQVDWLRETKPKRIVDVGAYLADAIRKDHAPPARFESKAQRAARETARRAVIEQEAAARRTKAQERQEQDRIKTYRESLTPEQRSALDAEALAGADPETRAAYETATTTQLKTMLLTALRETLIRRLLGLPAAD